jgi:ankyrin repeat protein
LDEKLRHGSFKSVQKTEEKFGKMIWSALDAEAAFSAIKSKRDVMDKLIFLEKNQWSFEAKDQAGDSLLHKALEFEDLEVINFCIAKKIDTNAETNDGDRPLHYALTWGMVDVVKSLINGGANPSLWTVEKNKKYNFLHYAVIFANNDCIAAILESPLLEIDALGLDRMQKYSALHLAASLDKSEVIAMLVAKGADLKIRDQDGDTPLQWALKMGKMEAAKALREAGAV